ncbi:hypothetical protein G6F56_006665 [Rhizopus delemar]|nr:hypothetical protein G6F56_006665 [Rhizopus delemar]
MVKYHVPEPAPVTVILQIPTTPVGNPSTPVPPVPETTSTPDSLSLFRSVVYTPISTPNKDSLDISAPVSVATSTARIYDNQIIGQGLLDEVISHQTKLLLDKMPAPYSEYTSTDFMTIFDVASVIVAKSMFPKQLRIHLFDTGL